MATKTLNLIILCFFFIFGLVSANHSCDDDCHEHCEEGKSINITCNVCGCNKGQWVCTLIACPVKECDPNKYRSNCTDCVCRNGTWDCTGCPGTCGRACPVCKPIDIGCNCCSCNRGEWACTKSKCPYKECDPKEYPKDCSECQCKDGKWECKCCKSP